MRERLVLLSNTAHVEVIVMGPLSVFLVQAQTIEFSTIKSRPCIQEFAKSIWQSILVNQPSHFLPTTQELPVTNTNISQDFKFQAFASVRSNGHNYLELSRYKRQRVTTAPSLLTPAPIAVTESYA